jgi:hypothetical protein
LLDGTRYVFVLRGVDVEAVAITLGASSDIVSEVTGGDLQEGDTIILNPSMDLMAMDGPPRMFMP